MKNDDPVLTHSRKTYIRIDLGAATHPIHDAALTLTAEESAITFDPAIIYTFDLWGLNDGHPDEGWIEGSGETGISGTTPPDPITWNNAPANDTSGGGVIAGQTTLLDSFDISNTLADGEQIVISTPSLLEFLRNDTDDQVTFILTRRPATQPDPHLSHGIAAREQGSFAPPTLELTIPEPSIHLLGAAAIATLGAMRRRRNRWSAIR